MQFIMEEYEFEDLDLDNEWLEQLEKDNKKYKDFYTEQVEKIEINYVYVDSDNNISNIKRQDFFLHKGILKKNDLIYLIKGNQVDNNKKYELLSLLQYNIDLEPDEIINYLKDTDDSNFLKVLTNINDIKWNDTVMLFHDMNSLFIIYYRKRKRDSKTRKIHLINKIKKKLRKKYTRKRT